MDGVHRVSKEVFDKRNARAIPQEGDIIYAREAPAGNAATIRKGEIVCLGQRTVLIRPLKEFVYSLLLTYFINAPFSRRALISKAVGSTAAHVNMEVIRPFLIPLPPLQEQIRIVEEVERFFTIINSIETEKNELVGTISLMKSRVLGLAISGKLVPQEPSDESAEELLRRINPSAVPADKSHYELPANWAMAKGKDLFLPMKSTTPKGSTFKYIDIDSIDNINQCISAIKVLPFEKAPSRANRYTEKNNVLFSMVRPYLRNIALVTEDNCIASTGFYVCRPRECLEHKYLFYLMISSYVVDGLNKFMKGDNSPSINKGHIDHFDFPLPPLNEQKRIVVKVDELLALIDTIKQSLEA